MAFMIDVSLSCLCEQAVTAAGEEKASSSCSHPLVKVLSLQREKKAVKDEEEEEALESLFINNSVIDTAGLKTGNTEQQGEEIAIATTSLQYYHTVTVSVPYLSPATLRSALEQLIQVCM